MDERSEEECERMLAELPGHKIVSAQPSRELLFPTKRSIIEICKLDEIAALIYIPSRMDKTESNARIVRALELFENLKPADGAEGMLAVQMVGTHHAALECLKRANLPDQTPKGIEMYLRNAQKLMAQFERQMAALDKHRGKGQQKVTVEHVHVHSGGQAIVGSVATERRSGKKEPEAIEYHEPLESLHLGETNNSSHGKAETKTEQND